MPDIEQLSDREVEILRLLAGGSSNKDIARELVISVNTVKVHLKNIYAKLEVTSRTEATLAAVEEYAVSGIGDDPQGYRAEFVDLVRRARQLAPR